MTISAACVVGVTARDVGLHRLRAPSGQHFPNGRNDREKPAKRVANVADLQQIQDATAERLAHEVPLPNSTTPPLRSERGRCGDGL